MATPIQGILLINLGTPDEPTPKALRRYLKEFLMDPRVITLPWFFRALLVHGIILPFRSPKSALKYQSIWTEKGSPLMVHSQAFTTQLRAILQNREAGSSNTPSTSNSPTSSPLAPKVFVELAMRYGNPSIASGLQALQHCENILCIPLFPQFAEATTGSIIAHVKALAQPSQKITFLPAFYSEKYFIESFANLIRKSLPQTTEDIHLLFSFHGLPKSQILEKTSCKLNKDCCVNPPPHCYYAQCLKTAKDLAQHLNWPADRWSTGFQSRLGRGEWIEPYTDETLKNLALSGKKRVAVVCPSFVADCLETLEEMGVENRDLFIKHGGEEYTLIPCLNAEPDWVSRFANYLQTDLLV